jgi:hypothetical protein
MVRVESSQVRSIGGGGYLLAHLGGCLQVGLALGIDCPLPLSDLRSLGVCNRPALRLEERLPFEPDLSPMMHGWASEGQ